MYLILYIWQIYTLIVMENPEVALFKDQEEPGCSIPEISELR